ncbi:hypothetical protein GQ44DRAFT_739995 [Phaeosphaeriaceae sp. PMI808]|nr:hypothetical protein GQ44DRAFT_739995 [Phaeosphaeriaceae sp. PMI808]
MSQLSWPLAGIFSLSSTSTSSSELERRHVPIPFYESEPEAAGHDVHQLSTLDLLSQIFKARTANGLRDFPSDNFRPKFFAKFITMAQELDTDGWFQGNRNSMCHLDLEPRNILINPMAESQETIITGILDWDNAVLAPSFLSCKSPLWIWGWKEDEDEDEKTANDVPSTEEERVLKSTFEEAAGPEYIRYAYPPPYRLARRLVRFALDDTKFNEDFYEAEAMLKEWTEIRYAQVRETGP